MVLSPTRLSGLIIEREEELARLRNDGPVQTQLRTAQDQRTKAIECLEQTVVEHKGVSGSSGRAQGVGDGAAQRTRGAHQLDDQGARGQMSGGCGREAKVVAPVQWPAAFAATLQPGNADRELKEGLAAKARLDLLQARTAKSEF